MMTAKFLKSALFAATVLFPLSETRGIGIDPHSYCLTCKEGCAGAVKQQCERMCMDIKEHVASLQMSRLTNATGKKFRTLRDRDKTEKADMLHDSPLYKCLGITRASKKEEAHEQPHTENNTACSAALQNVEDALNATLYELKNAKKTLAPHHRGPGKPSETHPSAAHHKTPPPVRH